MSSDGLTCQKKNKLGEPVCNKAAFARIGFLNLEWRCFDHYKQLGDFGQNGRIRTKKKEATK